MPQPILQVENLNVAYGGSHILHNTAMQLAGGSVSIIGRNGMGKTTFVKAIMGLVPIKSGSIRFLGQEIAGKKSHEIARLGIGYVPQGRRIFPSLTVDEHLRFAAKGKAAVGEWDAERVYLMFPRLKERARQSGTSLSGGEQQMLAIGRALVSNPRLLIMDEPSEGLAPVIVEQLREFCVQLVQTTDIAILLVEQSLPLAKAVAEETCVMVTGQFAYTGSILELLADEKKTGQLLSVGV